MIKWRGMGIHCSIQFFKSIGHFQRTNLEKMRVEVRTGCWGLCEESMCASWVQRVNLGWPGWHSECGPSFSSCLPSSFFLLPLGREGAFETVLRLLVQSFWGPHFVSEFASPCSTGLGVRGQGSTSASSHPPAFFLLMLPSFLPAPSPHVSWFIF